MMAPSSMLSTESETLSMQISHQEHNGVHIYALDGRVDSEGVEELENTLTSAFDSGQYKLVLDMAALAYINSAGLRVLAEALTVAKEHDGNVHLAALSTKIQRVLKIIGFEKFFNIYDDADAAINAF
ncbi:MAG: STAS domain-containing protein [Chloroflexi bacterium]|nr:STAS domain-containing protein [Chloroflexota bacterium]